MPICYIVSPDAPEKVFSKGFSTPESINVNEKLKCNDVLYRLRVFESIKYDLNKSEDQKFGFYVNHCFEAAPIFPLAKKSDKLPYTYEDSTPEQLYIYTVELEYVPFNIASYDIGNFFEINARDILDKCKDKDKPIFDNMAHELNDSYRNGDIVPSIEPSQIIAAVQIIRSSQKPPTADLSVYSNEFLGFKTSNERNFKVKSTVYINQANGSEKRQDCIKNLKDKLNKEFNTPPLMDEIKRVLGKDNDNRYLLHTTYLNYNLQNGYYFEAFMSIARSIYYRIKNAFSNLYNKILPAKIEEPSECLIIPENSKDKALTSENNNALGADLSKNPVITTSFSNARQRSNSISSHEQQSSSSEEKEDLPHFTELQRERSQSNSL